ncbi:Putative phage tail fiber protein [Escherichia coli]|nr:Putative phage tail fiber protein [Escherichia coli]
MTGELKIGTMNALRIFNDAFGLIFRRSEEYLHFIPTAEGQGENGDIGPLRPFAINLRTGAISVSHGPKLMVGWRLVQITHWAVIPLLSEITTLVLNRAATVSFYSIQMDNWHSGFNPHLLIFISGLHIFIRE